MFDFVGLFQMSYWFTARPLTGILLWIAVGILFIVLLFGIVIDVLLRLRKIVEYRGVWRQASSFAWTMSIIGLIWVFFFYQGVPILSARAWIFVWLMIGGIWKYFILKYFLKIRKKYHLSEKK